MGTGMKILKTAMLTLLATLCVAGAVVFVVYLVGESGDDALIGNRPERGPRFDDSDAAFDDVTYEQRGEEFDTRFLQRLMSFSEETGLYSYYPLMPYDVMPGETAVLGVSTEGFKGWEVDPNYAHVELFNETFVDDMVYISFIMPEEEASVAALYDEAPYINYEIQKEEFMAKYDMHEYGESPITALSSTDPIMPGVGGQLDLYAVTNVYIFFTFLEPEGLLPDFPFPNNRWTIEWKDWVDPPTVIDDDFVGMGWVDLDTTGVGGQVRGTPRQEGIYEFDLRLEIRRNVAPEGEPVDMQWRTFGVYSYKLIVYPPDPLPVITTESVPDGMVDVPYNFTINTLFLDTQTIPNLTWTWVDINVLEPRVLPNGLELRSIAPNHTSAALYGTPTSDALTGSPTAGPVFNFEVRIQPRPGYADLVRDFEIKIWEQPVISPPTWPTAPPNNVWLDGMVGQPYNEFDFVDPDWVFNPARNGKITATCPAGLPGLPVAEPISGPPILSSWEWVRSGDDWPAGLGLVLMLDEDDPDNIMDIALTGVPAAGSEGIYNVTLRFRSFPNNPLIIGESKPITLTIRIWPRPHFVTDPARTYLPDGMVGAGTNADPPPAPEPIASDSPLPPWSVPPGSEPDEVYRPGRIEADGFPDGYAAVVWHRDDEVIIPDYTTGLPLGLKYTPSIDGILDITGITTDNTEAKNYSLDIGFSLDHPNPNINGAREDKEHTITIWRRAYLSVILEPRRNNSTGGNVSRDPQLEGYKTFARAVIPGEVGEVLKTMVSSTGFVRWEITKPESLIGPSFNGWGIGDNWDMSPLGGLDTWASMKIAMPKPMTAGALDPTAPPINVEVTGWDAQRPLLTPTLPTGVIGVDYPGRFVVSNRNAQPTVLGADPARRGLLWEVVLRGDNEFPPGLFLDPGQGFIDGEPDPPSGVVYDFHVGLTLPGTMRLTYGPYSIFIDEFRALLGDVDGNGTVNLADLLMLRRFLYGTNAEKAEARAHMELMNSMRNANIITDAGEDPDARDLSELARWFAIQGSMHAFQTNN